MDIQQTKELVDLVLTVHKIGKDSLADGQFNLTDFARLAELFPVVGPGLNQIDQVPAELADMDAAEATELVTHVMTKLVVDDPKARQIVEASLKVAIAGYNLYLAVKA